ncbi:DUF4962 domain-containing protein [Paenibacillus qinlingensis]|uniref:DUF4962 domain-containing protein n=1 Tax=Paenibacillus qinlingensis TaxID=1837343 RepID=UPI001564FED7|nr:DUF4962 domain-containing protein [Paenibacillus qinlingensis]NQX58074.1 DUF4962 domain-containing protein [Paenibacillus qinlingensis]
MKKGMIGLSRSSKTRLALGMILILLTSLFDLTPFVNSNVAKAASSWPSAVLTGLNTPFAPEDRLVTTQNPPDFRWPSVPGADQYDLQVSQTPTVTNVVYENDALDVNYYNFPHLFETGTWYWRVRYHTPSGGWSDWSQIRRFRIDADYVPFIVPSVDTLLSQVGSQHPRIWTKPETLESFRSIAQTSGKAFYEAKLAWALTNVSTALPKEPTTVDRAYSDSVVNEMMDMAFVYLISNNETVGKRAIDRLKDIAKWNTSGVTSYASHDQIHRYITYKSAMAYDWLYGLMNQDDRNKVKAMVLTRTKTMVDALTTQHPIPKNPFDSHGWTAYGYIGIIATAMLHDLDDAESWFRSVVPSYMNLMPPWGGENGGWAQGTGYWQWSSLFGKEFMDVLLAATGFNLYEKAYSRNEGLYPLYAFPKGSPKGIFGDGSEDSPGGPNVSNYNRLAQMYKDPHLKWAAQAVGTGMYPDLSNYFYGAPDVHAKPPVDMPDSRWFQDIGLVAMHEKLYDPDSVSLYFKSSPFGSFNHSHADQNSFIINAFGEPLAIESGFYDDYDTDHDKYYAKQTLASNAITVDGKYGQPVNSIDADGKVVGFVTHPDFDAVSGDASVAYATALSKADRSIIYIRPNMFVVIDNLQSKKAEGNEFEWRLHAEDDLTLDADQAGATILKGEAALKVRFHAPQQLRTEYEEQFLGIGGMELQPTKAFSGEQQKHAAFITPKTVKATFVSTLEAYKRDSAPQNVISENHGDYLKLTFADGTIVYVRMTDTAGEIVAGQIRFNGSAIAVKDNSILLIDGTKVVKDGITLIESDQKATIAYGRDRLSVSSLSDTQVRIHAPGINKLVNGSNGKEIPRGGSAPEARALRGVYWDSDGNDLLVHAESGQRDFKLNQAPVPSPLPDVSLPVIIDGVSSTVTLQAYSDTLGAPVAWGNLSNSPGLYVVEEAPSALFFEQHGRRESIYLEANAAVILEGNPGLLRLRKVQTNAPAVAELWTDPDSKRNTLYMQSLEAESFAASGGKSFSKYANRPFLSGGIGLGAWEQPGQWAKWTIQVPRSGKYDLVMKYVAWDPPAGKVTGRLAMIGNKPYYLEAPTTYDATGTPDWGRTPEVWKGLRVKTGQQLEAGPVDVTMWLTGGPMNLDWIALMENQSDEVRPTAPSHLQITAQTDTTATLSWTPSTDNVGVKAYNLYVNGVQKKVIPSGTTSETITDLTPATSYTITLTSTDTSDNRSLTSAPLVFATSDTNAPDWGSSSTLKAEHLFTSTARLTWSPATDNSGKVVSYSIYRADGTVAGTVAGHLNAYDVDGLVPGASYTFRVEAADAQGNRTANGPSLTIAMPATASGGEYYESFDSRSSGILAAPNWKVDLKKDSTSTVTVEPLVPSSSKILLVKDSTFPADNEYVEDPIVTRSNLAINGKAVFETRFMYNRLCTDSNDRMCTNLGNFELKLGSSGTDILRFSGFSDGTFGYWNTPSTAFKIPKPVGFFLPQNQWVTLRVDLDTALKKVDLSVQMDALKGYTGIVDDYGTLNRTTGVYQVKGIPFYTDPVKEGIDSFRFSANRFTGKYAFDYVTLYQQDAPDQTAPVTTASLSPLQPDGPNGTYTSPVTVTLTGTDDASGVAKSEYSLDNGVTWRTYTSPVTFDKQGAYTWLYKSTDKAGNIESVKQLNFALAATTVKVLLKDSTGNPLSGGVVSYYDGDWKPFGITDASGSVSQSLPDKSYAFAISYEGTRLQLSQHTGSDALVQFRTVNVKLLFQDSQGNRLSGGEASYYADGWRTFGTSANGEVSKELLPGMYSYAMSYEGTRLQLQQNTAESPVVLFQTVNTRLILKDSQGNPLGGGSASYYADGWRTVGAVVYGEVSKELLPGTYSFAVSYEGTRMQKQQNTTDDPAIQFQTANVVVQLKDAQGNPINGEVSYYADGWRTFGTSILGEVKKELLPGTYTITAIANWVRKERLADTTGNPIIVIQW